MRVFRKLRIENKIEPYAAGQAGNAAAASVVFKSLTSVRRLAIQAFVPQQLLTVNAPALLLRYPVNPLISPSLAMPKYPFPVICGHIDLKIPRAAFDPASMQSAQIEYIGWGFSVAAQPAANQ